MFKQSRPVRIFLAAQMITVIVFTGASAAFFGASAAIAVLLGGGVALMNAVGTAYAWPRILDKKDVALSLCIIVSKFALSIGVFYWLTRPSSVIWFGDQTIALGSASGTLVAFALGLASVVPAALVVSASDLSGE